VVYFRLPGGQKTNSGLDCIQDCCQARAIFGFTLLFWSQGYEHWC